ncbi:FUSC family protein [Virgibacillus sediminis]|uniref:FUSC family protein n=1 Tax=Virgibacillus sediminis TaxID=202260 RepID=A0ABV7A9A5_9BACI
MSNSSDHTFWTAVKQAFEIKKVPFPWIKAILAGICAGTPIFLGLLLGNFQYGMYGSIGSFTFLYMFNEPLAQRAKKLFFVALGLAAAVGIGTLLAPYPLAMAVTVGFIGAFVTFLFGTLKFPGPDAIFFVLAFTIASAMDINPAEAPIRAGLVFLGGMLSWVVAMSGWFVSRRGPEIKALKAVYSELGSLLDSAGTEAFGEAREKTLQQIKTTGDTLSAGYISWDKSAESRKLYYLYEQANHIFSEVAEYQVLYGNRVPNEFSEAVHRVAESIDKNRSIPERKEYEEYPMLKRLADRLKEIAEVLEDPQKAIEKEIHFRRPPLRSLFAGALHKNSIVFISSLRNGFVLTIAALIAFSFDFDRAYWIPLSCAAVMMGTTVMTTFHRAIQRSVGTIIGIFIASILLSSQPDGWMIAIIIVLLTFGAEMFIPRNYALAAFFFTSTAIFMAENSTQIFDVGVFATIRVTDVLIGCSIGLLGTFLIGRRSASSRLPHLLAKTIRSQMQLLVQLFSDNQDKEAVEDSGDMRKMLTNLNNLDLVYSTALGEIPRNKRILNHLWPIIFSVKQLGYLLEAAAKRPDRPILTDVDMAQLLLIFERMAQAAKQRHSLTTRKVPELPGHPHIQKEIADLQAALQLRK